MRHRYSFPLLLLPLAMLLTLTITLLIQRRGVAYEVNSQYYQEQQFLPNEIVEIKNFFPEKKTTAVIIYDSETPYKAMRDLLENVMATLDSMRVKYDLYDVNSGTKIDTQKYEVAIFALLDISKIDAQSLEIVDWVKAGGKIFFTIRPDISSTSNLFFSRTGAINTSQSLINTRGIEFLSDLLPGAKGLSLGNDFIINSSYTVDLDSENCIVHIVSGESDKTPLLWVCTVENGRSVIINSDQFVTKDSRGLIGSAYTLLFDVFVYPVINSSTLYIDDFPAPVPGGSNELITKFYNMDTEKFFRDVWWGDMQNIAKKYNIKYTVGMIETYEYNLTPPLPRQLEVESQKYFGGGVLASGGEIIFHGYNHVPFCLSADGINKSNEYPDWPSTEAQQLSLIEVFNFGNSVFDNYFFRGYMPPSNILCPNSRRWLTTVVPDLKYVASVYLPDIDGQEYQQEFEEALDGVIEFPRIVSGYDMTDNEYALWAVINELSLHYVNSHFVHPDDMLDLQRGAEKGWDNLRNQYDVFLKWLQDSAPGLRNTIGSEGAMAVQRFYRLAVNTNETNGTFEILLGNFYDEAWLMLRTTRTPLSIEGGALTQVSTNQYLIQALQPKIVIVFEE